MAEHMGEREAVCPACGHDHSDADCECGCEYDPAFCGVCGWLDCECPKLGDGDRVRVWLGPPKMGGWHHGKVVGIDNLSTTGVQIKFDYPVKGEWFCYATHDEVERVLSPAPPTLAAEAGDPR